MRAPNRRLAAGLALVAAVLLTVLVHRAGTEALLAAPLLALLAPLLAGRYVGEAQIGRLAAARRTRRRPAVRPRRCAPAQRARRALVPRGGRLLATSLAVRPPPAAPTLR